MKKFIMGFLTAALLFTAIPIGAAIEEYICYKADYKVIVTGTEYINEDLPILNYKGSTYAPFRSILEAAGLNVHWNTELKQAEVTVAPVPEATKEVETVSGTTIEYDAVTGLPVGAEYVEYQGCTTAVEYGGRTFVSESDLLAYFGVKYVKASNDYLKITYSKNGKEAVVDFLEFDKYFKSETQTYYDVSIFETLLEG